MLGTLVGRAPRSLRLSLQRGRRLRSDITYGANDADVDALIEESLVGVERPCGSMPPPAASDRGGVPLGAAHAP